MILLILGMLFARCETLSDVKMCHCVMYYGEGDLFDCNCEHEVLPVEIFGTDEKGMNIILKNCGD